MTLPPKVFFAITLAEKIMKFWLIVNGLSTDFNETENCPYLREEEGYILETSEFKKIHIFFSLCDN